MSKFRFAVVGALALATIVAASCGRAPQEPRSSPVAVMPQFVVIESQKFG